MKNVGFIVKYDSADASRVAASLVKAFAAKGIDAVLGVNAHEKHAQIAADIPRIIPDKLAEHVDTVLVIGGDGTFLAAARALYGSTVPLLGINLGHVGFLSEIDVHQAFDALVADLLADKFTVEQRPFYAAKLLQDGKAQWEEPFLNDAVIQRNADEKMLQLHVDVDGKPMSESRADGLIIATPTGSTAYNLSTGGPILHPQMDGLVLAPICPHKLSLRPIVIPPLKVVVNVESAIGHVSIDGRKTRQIRPGDKLEVVRATHHLHMLKGKDTNFFTILRHKLGWDAAGSQRQSGEY